MQLSDSVTTLFGVGEKLRKNLARLGIVTLEDLMNHFPVRHEDWREIKSIGSLRAGSIAALEGTITMIVNRRTPRKRMMLTEALMRDRTGSIRVTWFNQPFLTNQIKVGETLCLCGKVELGRFGLAMLSPVFEKASKEQVHTRRLVPFYPLTAGITQKQLRFLIWQAFRERQEISEWLPPALIERANLMPLGRAVRTYHFPHTQEERAAAEERLKFDELLLVHLLGMSARLQMENARARSVPFREEETRAFVASLPFTLTPHQKKAAWEILRDMEKLRPMNRLLEGDVGCGKTVVAALAALQAVRAGLQVAIMSPTEVLAQQHYATFKRLLHAAGVRVGIWTKSVKEPARSAGRVGGGKQKATLTEVGADVVIGTHALLQEKITFRSLGLVVIDEQHRFGVDQRRTIKEKSGSSGTVPHFLSMTATPIPRSYALTVFGDLDLSIIPELPPGRVPVQTRLVVPHLRERAYAFVAQQLQRGRQAFVLCPLIEPVEGSAASAAALEKKSVLEQYGLLSKQVFPKARVAFLHGRMKSADKERVMADFARGDTDVLVTTSVVEVGVDIPNASVMWIEGAERFGLAQLHQFRGRVGRGKHASYCLAFTDSDSKKSLERLALFEQEHSGFTLAQKDLEIRGPGEVFGTQQSGMMHLRLTRLSDRALIQKSRASAAWLLKSDPTLGRFPALYERFTAWKRRVHLE